MKTLSVSGVARQISREAGITVAPPVISNLFYTRRLDDGRCPVVGRQRQIPEDIPEIEAELRNLSILVRAEGAK